MDNNTERIVADKNHAIVDKYTVMIKEDIEVQGIQYKKGDKLEARKLSNGKYRVPVNPEKGEKSVDFGNVEVQVLGKTKVTPEPKPPTPQVPMSHRPVAGATVSIYAELPLIWFTPECFALCKTTEDCAFMANTIAESIIRAHIVSRHPLQQPTKENDNVEQPTKK